MASVEKYEPTDQDRGAVEGMAFAGVTQEAIADFLGISKDQLGRHFRQELNRAQGGRVAKVAQANYERAIGYDPETRTDGEFEGFECFGSDVHIEESAWEVSGEVERDGHSRAYG
jgi:hypothetical protein